MFGHAFQANKTISTKKWNHQWTINIFIHFLTTESQGLMRFPSPNPPPRPRLFSPSASTAAFASRSRWTTESWPFSAAKCSGVWPREPRPSPRQNPRRKIRRKFLGTSKVKVLKIVATQKSSLNFRNIVVWRCVLMTSSWLKTLCQPRWQSKWFGTIIHSSICMGQLRVYSFSKRTANRCWLYTNYHKNHQNQKDHKNFAFKSKHGTTKRNESTPGHCLPLHHVIVSPNLQGVQATSLRPLPFSSVFCREFTSLRIKCRMAPTLFSLAASKMSRPRIPFKSKIC